MRRHFRAVIKGRQAWSVDVKCCLILARTCDDVYLRNQSSEAAAQPGWTWVMLFISIFFSTFLLVFRSLIIVGSQNKDDPTAYKIHHDIRQNQRSELLTFLSILKTNLLIDLFVLYSTMCIVEWHSCWQVGTGYIASKIRTSAQSRNTLSMTRA